MRKKGSWTIHAGGYARMWSRMLSLVRRRWPGTACSAGKGGTGCSDFLFLPAAEGVSPSASRIRKSFRKETCFMPEPRSWCCISRFQDQPRLRVVELPPGAGQELRSDMEVLVRDARSRLRSSLLGEDYRQKVSELLESYAILEKALAGSSQPSPGAAPPEGGDASLQEESSLIKEGVRSLEKLCAAEIDAFTWCRAHDALQPLFSPLRSSYRLFSEVLVYLDEVEEDILRSLHLFTLPEEGGIRESVFAPYEPGVLSPGTMEGERPVVFVSPHASREDLFGFCSPTARASSAVSRDIRPGDLHVSNGGFLVLEVSWILRRFPLWESVKAVVKKKELGIPSPRTRPGVFLPAACAPQAIPYHARVVVTGDRSEIAILSFVDPDVSHLACGSGGKPAHMSAREEVISLCSLPQIRERDLPGHFLKILSLIEKSGGGPVTDLHIRQALVELYPDLARTAMDSWPRRRKIRRHPEEDPASAPEGAIIPIKLYPRKVITYGKQT
jgi:hypothetical protein